MKRALKLALVILCGGVAITCLACDNNEPWVAAVAVVSSVLAALATFWFFGVIGCKEEE